MYVLVNGTADVFLATNGAPRRVRTLTRGDVFGEMGLIRHHERTADVVATEGVGVLMGNERFLNRLIGLQRAQPGKQRDRPVRFSS